MKKCQCESVKVKIYLLFLLCLGCHILIAETYYWVGECSGNWSDLNHWATSSGGMISHQTLPTGQDEIIFDENSFNGINQSVIIDIEKQLNAAVWIGEEQLLIPNSLAMGIIP